MSLAMWRGLSDRLTEFAQDDDIRGVVLSGAGEKAFVSGADISEFERERSDPTAVAHFDRFSEDAENAVASFPKPVIAKIGGYCLGGGVGLAIGCDLRICSDSSRFAFPVGKLGLGYSYDGVTKLIGIIGPARAAEQFMTGQMFDTSQVLAFGLVNHVVARDALNQSTLELAKTIASNAPQTMRAFKAAKIEQGNDPGPRNRASVDQPVKACFASKDYQEGRAAFAGRRKPSFKGE